MGEKKNFTIYILIVLSILFIPLAYIYAIYLIIRDLVKRDYKTIEYLKSNKYLMFISISVLVSTVFSKYVEISSFFGVMIFVCIGIISYLRVNFKVEDSICDGHNLKCNAYNLTKLLTIIYIATLISYMIGFFQLLDPMYIMPKKWIDMNEYNVKKRIFSSFLNPNVFGFYINIIIITICTRFSTAKNKKPENIKFEILEKVTFICSIICLFYTFSRASWISLVSALFLVGILFDKKYILFSIIIFICIFGADAILGINRSDITKLSEDSSLAYRIELWKTSLKIIKDNLITGIGFGTFYKFTGLYSNIVKKYIEHCHNIYLQILMETGIIGFTVFLITLYSIVKRVIKEYILDKNNNLSILIILTLSMTLIHGVIDSVSLTPQIMMILSMIIGIYLAVSNKQKKIVIGGV
jgi:O-antigen ligase